MVTFFLHAICLWTAGVLGFLYCAITQNSFSVSARCKSAKIFKYIQIYLHIKIYIVDKYFVVQQRSQTSGEQSRLWAAGGVRIRDRFTVMKAYFFNFYQQGKIGFRTFCAHTQNSCHSLVLADATTQGETCAAHLTAICAASVVRKFTDIAFYDSPFYSWVGQHKNIILLRYGNRNLLVAGNGGKIFSNGLSGDLEISNSGMSPFPLR